MRQLSPTLGARGRAAGDGVEWEGDLRVLPSPPLARMSYKSLSQCPGLFSWALWGWVCSGCPRQDQITGLAMCGVKRPQGLGPVPSLQPHWDVQGGHTAWSGDGHGGRAGSGVPATAFHSLLGVLLSCERSQSGVEPRSGQVCAPLRLGARGWERDVGLAQPSPLCSIPSFPATTLVHVAQESLGCCTPSSLYPPPLVPFGGQ